MLDLVHQSSYAVLGSALLPMQRNEISLWSLSLHPLAFHDKVLLVGTIRMLIIASAAGIVRSPSEATYSGPVEEEMFGGLKDDSLWNLNATLAL